MRSFILGLAMAAVIGGLACQCSDAAANDETQAQLIANDLKESGQLKNYRVGVKYKDGVAWLMGTVTSQEQKRLAVQIASNSDGVAHVVSKLTIERPVETQPQRDTQVESASMQSAPTLRKTASRVRSRQSARSNNMPVPYARMGGVQPANFSQQASYQGGPQGGPMMGPAGGGHVPAAMGQAVNYDNPQVPGYAWPSYAASPNYAALTYPKQYSPSAWPYIGPFYPYPQVPLGWRKVTLEWDDGWWFLDFKDSK